MKTIDKNEAHMIRREVWEKTGPKGQRKFAGLQQLTCALKAAEKAGFIKPTDKEACNAFASCVAPYINASMQLQMLNREDNGGTKVATMVADYSALLK